MIVFTVPEDDKAGLAFMTALYRRYSRLMYTTARRCVSNGQDCEDIVQDAVESLCKKLHTLMDLSAPALPVYIVYTVKNQAKNFIRHQAVVQKHIVEWNDGCLDSHEALLPPPETLVELREDAARLYAVWPRLPEQDRELLYRKYVLGQSNEELAEIFQCRKDNIRMRLTRAKRKAISLMEGDDSHEKTRTLA